jgi:LexA-binding, inner membrane-associated putative hydrolase
MPSPLGHALGALTLHLLSARDRDEVWDHRRALVLVGAAVAPDLDLLFRYVDGRNHHQAQTHSVGAALAAGLLVALFAAWRGAARPARLGLWAGLAWGSHILLDYLGRDTHPPIGLLALWPLSDAYYKFPWPVFWDIGRTLDLTTVRHNVVAVAWELVILTPIPALLLRRRLRTGGRSTSSPQLQASPWRPP